MLIDKHSDSKLTIASPAKVNLFLEVLGKRNDGYHDIHSLFQAVSLYDILEFEITSTPSVEISIKGADNIPTDTSNLISKAYRVMQSRFGFSDGLTVSLDKKIPSGAGLGGGSGNAAATLLACNILFKLGLSNEQLAKLSLQIGSDIPFFFSSGQAIIGGWGEVVDDIALPLDYWLVLVTPQLHISTAEAYAGLRMGLTKEATRISFGGCRTTEELIACLAEVGNDFEPIQFAEHPILGRVAAMLVDSGASLVRMSGSGSTIFGIFTTAPDAERWANSRMHVWTVFTVRPIRLPA